MATRKLEIQIVGDSRDLERTFARSAKAAQKFQQQLGSTTASNTLRRQTDDLKAYTREEEKLVKLRSRRAASIGPFRVAGVGLGAGLGLFAATQAVRELGTRLEVTGRAAFTTEGRLRNMVSALTSGNIIGAVASLTRVPKTLEELGVNAGLGTRRLEALRQVAGGATASLHKFSAANAPLRGMAAAAKDAGAETKRLKDTEDLAGTASQQLAAALLGAENAAFAASFAQREYNHTLIDGINVLVAYKGAHDAAIGAVETFRRKTLPSRGPLSPSQRRELGLIGAEGTTRLPGLSDRLRQLRNQKTSTDEGRLRVLTNIKNTEAEIASIYRDQAAAAKAAGEAAQAAAEAAAARAKAAREQQLATQLGWLEFAAEKADVTKPISDNMKALRAIEKYWLARVKAEGRKLELVSELWRTQQRIRDLTKGDTDPLAGLAQVSTKKLTALLAAGTGLGGAGRRALGANISGAQIRPLYVGVNIDGREIGRATSKDQKRTGNRTSKQTSGRRY